MSQSHSSLAALDAKARATYKQRALAALHQVNVCLRAAICGTRPAKAVGRLVGWPNGQPPMNELIHNSLLTDPNLLLGRS